MNHKYFPHTEEEIKQMLQVAGVESLDDLYADVPESIRFKGDYEIADAMSELEIRQFFNTLGMMNDQLTCFAGGGVYDHYHMHTQYKGAVVMPSACPSVD